MNPILLFIFLSLVCLVGIGLTATGVYLWWRTREEVVVSSGNTFVSTGYPPPAQFPRTERRADTPPESMPLVPEAPDIPPPPPDSTGAPFLDGVGGMVAGQRIHIKKDEVVLGRSRVCDIQFHDPKISRQHAMIRYYNGRYFIQDMQSSRGTLVNQQPVETHMLQQGDEIRLGDSVMIFKLPNM